VSDRIRKIQTQYLRPEGAPVHYTDGTVMPEQESRAYEAIQDAYENPLPVDPSFAGDPGPMQLPPAEMLGAPAPKPMNPRKQAYQAEMARRRDAYKDGKAERRQAYQAPREAWRQRHGYNFGLAGNPPPFRE
jgi:hypothetical protein